MGIPRIDTGPMNVEEFYAFTDGRPDGEKWELIDGEAVLNASPSELHQQIIQNLCLALGKRAEASAGTWKVLPGLGVRVSETKRPEPDVLIVPVLANSDLSRRDRPDVIVAFEVLSPSTAARDLKWKRLAYTSLPSLTHYIVIAQDAVDIVMFSRDEAFAEKRLHLGDEIEFADLGIKLPVSEIYRDTGLL